MQTRSVAFLAFDGAMLLDITGPAQVFATANYLSEGRTNPYRTSITSPSGADVVTDSGVRLGVDSDVRDIPRPVDTLFVPGSTQWERKIGDEALQESLREAVTRSKRVASVCAGALLLASIGLLDGRRATTHWFLADELASRFPDVQVDPDPIFIEDGWIFTAAGISSGIDLALALVERDHGTELARAVAQFLVVFMQRPGSQSQFSSRMRAQPRRQTELRPLLDSIAADPAGDHRLETLSNAAGFSERHLARLFKQELGMTPARYVETVRIEAARSMLETSDAPLDVIARQSGHSSAETLRRSFHREVGVAPGAYRQRFRTTGVSRQPDGGTPAQQLS